METKLINNLSTQKLDYLGKKEIFFDRELSWLSFNERVLKTGFDNTIPIGERLRFLTISATNLDEFFMVRVAGLYQLMTRKYEIIPFTGKRIDTLMTEILSTIIKLKSTQNILLEKLIDELKNIKIKFYKIENLSQKENEWVEKYYEENILPLIAPTTLDPAHPFPFIQNQGKGLFIEMSYGKNKEINSVILLPKNLNRFIRLPGEEHKYIFLEDLITRFIDKIYPNHKLKNFGMFRVLRDSEIEIDDEADDLIDEFEAALKARRRGDVVSLEVSSNLSSNTQKFLEREFNINKSRIYVTDQFIDLDNYKELFNYFDSSFFYKAYKPRFPQRIYDFKGDCFLAIRNKDIIIHHPFETFDVVVNFLNQAAEDKNVLTIRQTLYRTTPSSPIVEALVKAAEKGKTVIAIIELKARFDEENNVQLARVLEKAGVQVAYGLVDLKVHSKLSLITRKENNKLVSYAHCGTGNYHPSTAKIYTDFSFFTTDKNICNDAMMVFNFLTSHIQPKVMKDLIISPNSSFNWLIEKIENEINFAKKNLPSGIWIKCNAIVDTKLIEKLYEASKAGVKINLFVRGICCLKPNVKGLSENITVKSIIGRFLEHGRIYVFANGGEFQSNKNDVYISSADMMPRNLYTRVEAFVPLKNETVRSQILTQVLPALINDVRNSWLLEQSGEYVKLNNKLNFCSHSYFMENPSLSGQGSLSKVKIS